VIERRQFLRTGVAGLVHKGNYYYLFVFFDNCCAVNPYQDTYRIMVGRGTSPQGPFLDMNGTDMMQGGGTQLLAGDDITWSGPGGQTAYLDPVDGDTIVFHAIHLPDGAAYLFVNSLTWPNDWRRFNRRRLFFAKDISFFLAEILDEDLNAATVGFDFSCHSVDVTGAICSWAICFRAFFRPAAGPPSEPTVL
jgi:hypothetical protein